MFWDQKMTHLFEHKPMTHVDNVSVVFTFVLEKVLLNYVIP